MSAQVITLPQVRPTRELRRIGAPVVPLRWAFLAGLLPYSTMRAVYRARQRGLLPGVARRPGDMGGYELTLDPFYADVWLARLGRVTLSEYLAATPAQVQAWQRAGALRYSRKVSRLSNSKQHNIAKN